MEKDTDVVSWLMYYVKPVDQHVCTWKFQDLYERYLQYCSQNNVTVPATKKCFSCNLYSLYSSVQLKGDRKDFLYGIECQLHRDISQAGDVTAPPYCDLEKNGNNLTIHVPTVHVVNGKQLLVTLRIQDSSLKLFLGENELTVTDIGMSDKFVLNQENLDGLLTGLQHVVFCKGKKYSETFEGQSQRVVIQEWSSLDNGTSASKRVKGKKCLLVLPFSSKSEICNKCAREVHRVEMKANKENEQPHNGDTEPQLKKMCESNEDTDMMPDSKLKSKVHLNEDDHQDLMAILDKALPTCTDNFRVLLESQLKVAKSNKDPRSRRWDLSVISLCLSLWGRSRRAYEDLRESGFLVLPSGRLLQYFKNSVNQTPGFNSRNLQWMASEARRRNLPDAGRRGGLIIDEMSIQDDLLVRRKNDCWEIAGAVDLGELCNDIRVLRERKKECALSSDVLQLVFLGYNGFRWPVAYFPTKTAVSYELHLLFWEAVDILGQYGFGVDYCSMDGASTNRSFINMHFAGDPRDEGYTTFNIFDPLHPITFIQDIKHTLKKIRNGLESRTLIIEGTPVVWEHWVKAFDFNSAAGIRIHKKLTAEHVVLTPASKMRNHLATEVLDGDMLSLMQAYAKHLGDDGDRLKETIHLLENTSVLVSIFLDKNRPITSTEDMRLQQIAEVLQFFNLWEMKTDNKPSLLSQQTRDDLNSALTGFLQLVQRVTKDRISITPGYINSDVVENFFCQQRGLCNGMATNPTISQYGPGVNAIILGQSTVSKKSNSGQKAEPICAKKRFPLRPSRCKKLRI